MGTAQFFRTYQHQSWLKACTNPVGKALWFIETLYVSDITLDDIAGIGGVSRHHMARAFGFATGSAVLRYVRGRRLTEAARLLANDPPDVRTVALEYGYPSHEAFARAFRDQFGVTPETVRAQKHLDHIDLVEPIKMQETLIDLEPPRFVEGRALLVAGIGKRYNSQTSAGIPAQWQRFHQHAGKIPGRIGTVAYGVRCNSDDAGNTDYVCGVEVSDLAAVPPEFYRLRIAPQRYAVFAHRGNVSEVRRTWHTVWNHWLPESGYAPVDDAPDFERYGERFDPKTGSGGLEIWVPVRRAN
jgi:AraC family transcriptional regulator